jgi:8-oxo-dGTP pyrophosphatase MutT (NUDIX family)
MSESTAPERDIGAAEHTHTVARERTAATVVFTDDRGRVLLCEPTCKQVWEAPGGAVEADESPRMAAVREIGEALGLAIEPGRLVAVDWVPPMDGRFESVVFVFDGGRLDSDRTESIRLRSSELGDWEWCTVEQAHERMRPIVARRIESALAAVGTGSTVYLEAGYPVR